MGQVPATLGLLGMQELPVVLCSIETEEYWGEGCVSRADAVPFYSLLQL